MAASTCAAEPGVVSPPPAPAAPSAEKKPGSDWVFSLLPKSLQQNPHLELTVITEVTDEGKKRPSASAQNPVYFELYSAGFRQQGHPPGGEKTLTREDIERLLTRSLASNGFLPAEPPSKVPAIVIIYSWGSHNLLTEGDDENPVLSSEQVARNLLDRAALVGGDRFAKQMLTLFEEADSFYLAAQTSTPPGSEPVFTPELLDFTNPVNLFKRRSPKNEALVEQAAHDVYFVVASAYDYTGMAKNQRQLLWRTRMTVASAGVSQLQTLPTLVLTAAPYFGMDMPEPEVLTRRSMRTGTVEIGTPTVVDPNVPNPKKRAPKK
ncbi:MAG: hypothetical protein Q7S40_13515 [Opitutaceae bacterium]|nr:hypothetical protein [Opitutaceae bacterium]